MRINRVVLGFGYRPIHDRAHARLVDLVVPDRAAIDKPGIRRPTAAFADLFDHRHHLPLVATDRDDLDAHEHQGVGVARQLRVVRRPEAAVATLHDRRLGIRH